MAGLEHADLPFERIAELTGLPEYGVALPEAKSGLPEAKSGQPADSGGRPPVRVRFACQPPIPSRFALGGVNAEVLAAPHGAAASDLAMSLFDDGEGFSGYLEYRGDRFSPAFAATLTAEFTELLAGLTEEGAGGIPWTTTTPSLTS
jgi:hypothetical protein